ADAIATTARRKLACCSELHVVEEFDDCIERLSRAAVFLQSPCRLRSVRSRPTAYFHGQLCLHAAILQAAGWIDWARAGRMGAVGHCLPEQWACIHGVIDS